MRHQLSLLLSLTLAAAFGAAIWASSTVARGVVLDELVREQDERLRMLSWVADLSARRQDPQFLQQFLETLRLDPGVDYAYVLNPDGRFRAHSHPEFVGRSSQDWRASGRAAGGVEKGLPVYIGRGPRAEARIGYASERVHAALHRTWRRVFIPLSVFGVLGLALTIFIGISVAVFLTRRLEGLSRAAERVSQGGLDVEVPVEGSDELSQLSGQFNMMMRQLKKLDAMKAQFIANVTHDLSSPLASVIAYADYLLSGAHGDLNPKQEKYLRTIKERCQHLTGIVDAILKLGKLQSGGLEFELEDVDTARLLSKSIEFYELEAKRRKLTLTRAGDAAAACRADPERLRQVLDNLLSNALKFVPEGGRVEVGAARRGAEVELWVRDDGPGIEPDELPRVFERYHQAPPKDRKERRVGTGLGLAVSKGIVEGMGGRIWAESKPGKGATFHLRLPAAGAAKPKERAHG